MLRIILFIISLYSVNALAKDGIWILVDTDALKIEVKNGEKTLDTIEDIAIGQSGAGQKLHRGDNITPKGEYHIAWVGEKSLFHRFFGLDYPSVKDADAALRKGSIDKYTHSNIINAHLFSGVPPQHTVLGGRIGIHGLGRADEKIHRSMNWTHGCIALTNKQIDHFKPMDRYGHARKNQIKVKNDWKIFKTMLEFNWLIYLFSNNLEIRKINMRKLVKGSLIALVASLTVGCATNSDIESLQTQIDGLKTSVAQASSDAASAQTAAADAKAAAERAAQYAQETNSKLDSMFKHSMMK